MCLIPDHHFFVDSMCVLRRIQFDNPLRPHIRSNDPLLSFDAHERKISQVSGGCYYT